MEFEWDDAKDAANRAKHSVSLADAVGLDWEAGQTRPDLRADYLENRSEILAKIGDRLHACIFTMRGGVHRIISSRKANTREELRYEQARSK